MKNKDTKESIIKAFIHWNNTNFFDNRIKESRLAKYLLIKEHPEIKLECDHIIRDKYCAAMYTPNSLCNGKENCEFYKPFKK